MMSRRLDLTLGIRSAEWVLDRWKSEAGVLDLATEAA
jgi:hypothetical protein